MPIQANVTNSQITATVGETKIDVAVSGGVGPTGATGPQGPAGSGGVTSLQGLTGALTLAAVGGSWAAAGGTITLTVTGASVAWADVTGKPSFATVATSGSYNDLSDKPSAYSLPTATASVLGGVKIGSGITITDGVISASSGYTLPTATASVLGGVKIGSGVTITDGVISVSTDYAAVSHEHSATAITSGTLDVARLPVGTGSTQVAAGDHTHTQLHDRSHAITSTSDHTATAWRVFYSDGSGNVTELALGSSGQALISQGASAAPSWGSAGSNSASDLTTGTLANARLSSRARVAMNTYLWSSFR